jgi:hypothetical protein
MRPEPAIALMLSCDRFLRLFGEFAVNEVGLGLCLDCGLKLLFRRGCSRCVAGVLRQEDVRPHRQGLEVGLSFQVMVGRDFRMTRSQ